MGADRGGRTRSGDRQRRQISRTFRGNRRDATKARAALLTELGRGPHTGTTTTVEDLFHEWIKELERKGRSPNTIHNYDKVYRHDIAATLGRVPECEASIWRHTRRHGQ